MRREVETPSSNLKSEGATTATTIGILLSRIDGININFTISIGILLFGISSSSYLTFHIGILLFRVNRVLITFSVPFVILLFRVNRIAVTLLCYWHFTF